MSKSFGSDSSLYAKSIASYPLLKPDQEYSLGIKLYDGRLEIIKAIMSSQDQHSRLISIISELDPDAAEIVLELIANPTETNYNQLHAYLVNANFTILMHYSEGNNQLMPIVTEMRKVRDILINSNLRLVASIAKVYTQSNVCFLDLVQEGNIGLITAVDRFNPYRSNKLVTVAVWWVRQSIIRYLSNNSRMIRLPIHVIDAIQKAYQKLNKKLDRVPKPEEMKKEVKLSFSVAEVEEIMSIFVGTEHYDNFLDSDESATYGDLFISPDILIDTKLVEEASKDLILKDLKKCTSREEKAFRLRIGF